MKNPRETVTRALPTAMPNSLLIALFLQPLLAESTQGPPANPVRVDPVALEAVQEHRLVTGRVRAARRSTLAAREAGLVERVHAREGAAVGAGEVLVEIDATVVEVELAVNAAERAEAEALVAEREARERQAAADVAALEELFERGAAGSKELADARSVAAAQAALLAGARAALETNAARRALLEQRQADLSPRAPFAGRIVARHVEQGQWVTAGGPLFELVSDELFEAWLDVPQELYAAVARRGGGFPLRLDAGGEVRAVAARAVPDVAAGARTFPLVAELAPDPALAAGMTLTADLPTGSEREALTVHRDAILRNEVGAYVYLAVPGPDGGGHVALFAPVEVLFLSGERAVVASPMLQPGALAVVEGNERLYPTAPVALQQGDQRGRADGGAR